jgi:hypothetical protein
LVLPLLRGALQRGREQSQSADALTRHRRAQPQFS